jgi:PadR family transcriptional regulator PadR
MELRPASYFVLAALLDGPLHGYAIAARARELSGGEVRLTAGTLYGALERSPGAGWCGSSARRRSRDGCGATTC